MKKILFLFLLPLGVFGQTNLTGSSGSVTESFTGYSGTSTLPTNWTTSGTGTNGNNFSGSNQTGGTSGGWYGNDNMSYLGSGSASNGNATWRLRNTTGAQIDTLTITFDARLWKSGTNSPTVSVSYSTNSTGTVPAAGGLTALSSLTFSDATSSITTGTSLTQTLTGLSIANNDYIYLRFIHSGGSNSDNLGWDNVKIDYKTCTPPSTPTGSISQTNNCGSVDLVYSGTPTNIYWQTSATGTSTASLVSSNLNVTAIGTWYARAYDGTSCWSTGTVSSTVSSVPNNSTISSQPSNSSIFTNANTSFAVSATNSPSYQWQVNTGSGFTNISNGGVYSGATASTLSITSANLGMDGYTYRCVVTSASPCTNVVNSNSALLTVVDGPCLSENFNSFTSGAPASWSGSGCSNYSSTGSSGASPNSVQFNSTGDYLETPTLTNGARSLSFMILGNSTGGTSAFLVEGFNGSSWTTIENITSIPTSKTTKTYTSSSTPSLPEGMTKFRFTYTKDIGNVAFDDVEVYCDNCKSNVTLSSSAGTNSYTVQCQGYGVWNYYGNGTNYYFAINKNGNSFTPTVDITVSSAAVDSSKSSNGANQEHGSYLMKRYWNVNCSGCTNLTTNGGVSVRFFYDPTDSTAARTAMRNGFTALKASNTSTLADTTTTMQWIKTNGVPYAPSNFTGNKMTQPHTKLTPTYGTLNGVRYVQFDNITSFSGGGGGFGFGPGSGGGGVGLPVTWAGFDASVQKSYTELLWYTASEQNTSHFEVEASENGKIFKKVSDDIPAAGNSASIRSYTFRDYDLAPIKYYRLRQVDLESSFEYSKTIVAKRTLDQQGGFDVMAYPTSLENTRLYQLVLKNKSSEQSYIQLVDYAGKTLHEINSMKNAEVLDLTHLTSGTYMLQVSNGGEKKVLRIVVGN